MPTRPIVITSSTYQEDELKSAPAAFVDATPESNPNPMDDDIVAEAINAEPDTQSDLIDQILGVKCFSLKLIKKQETAKLFDEDMILRSFDKPNTGYVRMSSSAKGLVVLTYRGTDRHVHGTRIALTYSPKDTKNPFHILYVLEGDELVKQLNDHLTLKLNPSPSPTKLNPFTPPTKKTFTFQWFNPLKKHRVQPSTDEASAAKEAKSIDMSESIVHDTQKSFVKTKNGDIVIPIESEALQTTLRALNRGQDITPMIEKIKICFKNYYKARNLTLFDAPPQLAAREHRSGPKAINSYHQHGEEASSTSYTP